MRKFDRLLRFASLLMLISVVGCEPTPTPEPTPQSADFTFENCTSTHTSLSVDIHPANSEWEYIVFLSGVDHFTNNDIDTEQELFEDDYLYFSELAAQYELPMRDFLLAAGWLTSGDKLGYKGINLYPDTEYCLYCYAVEFEGDYYSPITPIAATTIRTTAPELQSVTFDIATSVDGNIATLDIEPQGYDGYYYHYTVSADEESYIAPSAEIDEATIALYRNRAMREFNELIEVEGTSVDSFCHRGNTTIEERLEPNTDYMTIIFAVSDDHTPIMSSLPQREYFSTVEAKFSNLVLDIEVSNILSHSAQLHITPSSDEQYACALLAASQLPTADDEMELMSIILEQFMPATFVGEINEPLIPLMPETEYVVVAFGCDGTLPTSHLFEARFTTATQEVSSTYIEDIRILKFFDVAEIAALDERYAPLQEEAQCLLVVEAVTNRPCENVYYFWYESWMLYEYSKEAFVEDLLLYKPTPSPTVLPLWYSTDEFFFAGMAQDESGNYSDVYFGEPLTILYEERSPAEEFFTLGIDIYEPEFNM